MGGWVGGRVGRGASQVVCESDHVARRQEGQRAAVAVARQAEHARLGLRLDAWGCSSGVAALGLQLGHRLAAWMWVTASHLGVA